MTMLSYTTAMPTLPAFSSDRLVHRTLGSILRQAGVHHTVEPPHFRLERGDALVSMRGSKADQARALGTGTAITVSMSLACLRPTWVSGVLPLSSL